MKEVVMTAEAQNKIQTRAIEWHIRLRHGDDATWVAFTEWLADDPRHALAYDKIESTDLAIEPLLVDVAFREAANDSEASGVPPPVHRTRRWFVGGGALAAAIVAALAFAPQLMSSRYDIATGAGERRTVTLDPATQVVLNGSTRMTFDRENPRFAELTEGEALFRVRHDSANPFTLELGDNRVVDAGTVFNVVRQPGQVRVAVSEGKVIYNPQSDAVALTAGEALLDQARSTSIRITTIPSSAVGSWERGTLTYSQVPMSDVAADIARTLGQRIVVVSSLADRSFSGSIALNDKGSDQIRHLERALDVSMESGPDGWTMKPVDGAGR
jgi:transmembrane sensor